MRRCRLLGLVVALAACGDNRATTDGGPRRPECSDQLDNDGDGLTDFPADPGCSDADDATEGTVLPPACSDHRDNDGDGKIDFPDDPGCVIPQSDSEDDACPDGAGCPQCSNGKDDDGNGTTDFPADPGCDSAGDPVEFAENPIACGATLKIKPLPASGLELGTLDMTSIANLSNPCNTNTGTPGIAYLFVLTEPAVFVFSTFGSTADTVLDLRAASCAPSDAEIACNDNVAGTDKSSRLTRSLLPGAYYLIVSGKTAATTGAYTLKVDRFAGEGAACTDTAQCGPGLVCRVPLGGTEKVCAKPVCSDGRDDDGDGKIDYPLDPGCANPADGDELDDCPDGPSCAECSDGRDNDSDGATDYPMDPSCKAAGDVSEACITSEPIAVITGPTTIGDTTLATDDYDPVCNSSTGLAPDLLYRLDLPALSSLTLTANGFDTVTTLLGSSCGGTPLACSDPQTVSVRDLAAGTYYVTIEGWATVVGQFTLQTAGVIAPKGSCEGALYQSGALACAPGFTCDGPAGARTCRTECSDDLDNNGDGKVDFPNDPGCASAADNSETTVCPGPLCPECADGADNDGDTRTDYPADPTCRGAGSISETCATSEPIGQVTSMLTVGDTSGQVDDLTPSCGAINHTAPDLLYRIDLPAMQALTLTTLGFDTTHSLLNSTCAGPAIACSDPSLMTVNNLPAGTYYVAIDGSQSASGQFVLTTGGTIAPRGSCEGQLAASGAITCPTGFTCDGPPGARTCRTQCSDDLDNNGDGLIDYPADPGCTSLADDLEDTVCPGPACPQCADRVDNDSDGRTDYPADATCLAASSPSEVCMTSEAIAQIVGTTTTGNTTGAANDFKPACGSPTSHTAPDLLYQLDVPALQSLTLDVSTIVFDSVHSLLDSSCGPPIACSDPGSMTVSSLPAGRYYVVVDAYSTGNGPFTLKTTGVIAPGASCESPLVAAGTLTCATGTTCQGAAGARRCQSQCSDGIDNNGDGRIDFPDDPSCTSLADTTEATVCPGALCPACADGIDNDLDGATDYPADVGCASASGPTEAFCAIEPDFRGAISAPVTTGSLAPPAAGNYHQTCQSNTGNDVAYALVLPVAVRSLVIDTLGSTVDTVVSMKDSSCGAQLGCNDDITPGAGASQLVVTNVVPGNYAIQVDSYNTNGSNNGPFTLGVRGTVNNGTACASPLFASGVLACQPGASCTGGICR